MQLKSFHQYIQLRESTEDTDSKDNDSEESNPLGTKITLGDDNEYIPFEISDDPKSEHHGKNKNLAPIVRAFKEGANWGWSKDEKSGEDKPVKVGSKKLYLAGGAVRDHLAGKKARNMELATSASPDEVYHILKQNGFDFIGSDDSVDKGKNKQEGSKQSFWVTKSDKNGRPYSFKIKVNDDEFDLDVFQKGSRGYTGGDPEPGTHGDDASDRDFTLNGMYILLSNDNGPNKDLHDFYGGIHDLSSGRVQSIGDLGKRIKEDPSKLLRMVRMISSYGDPKKIPEENKKTIRNSANNLDKVDRKYMMGEFKKGLDKEDVDSRTYLSTFKDLGLLDKLFPGKLLDTDMPKELSEIGDKHMPLAWMLRMNEPDALEDLEMDPNDCKKIGFLIQSLGVNENIDADSLMGLIKGYMTSGVSGRKLKEWGSKIGKLDNDVLDAFIKHAKSPRVKMYLPSDDGTESISEDFADLVNPFTGQLESGVDERKKEIELRNFKKCLKYMKPA